MSNMINIIHVSKLMLALCLLYSLTELLPLLQTRLVKMCRFRLDFINVCASACND